MIKNLVAVFFGLVVFEVARYAFANWYFRWAWSVCRHFDYNAIPFPGETFWVATCSSLF